MSQSFCWYDLGDVCIGAVNKVASNSIRKALAEAIGFDGHVKKLNRRFARVSLEPSETPRLVLVRNPYDRLVSCFFDKVVNAVKEDNCEFVYSLGLPADVDFQGFALRVCAMSDKESDKHFKSQGYFVDCGNAIPGPV